MTRGIGEAEYAAGLSDPIAIVAALVTALGDPWFLVLVGGLLYWFGRSLPGPLSLSRRRAAFAIGLLLGAHALTTALKELFRLPRPPGASEPAGAALIPEALLPLYAEIGAATGFGFPSGHAIGAVVFYGGLALLVGRRRGYAVAGLLCVAIPLSRVALGVHYVVDVVAGVALGAAYLGTVYRVGDRGRIPGRALAAAVAVAVVGLTIAQTVEVLFALGGTLGGWLAWSVVGAATVEAPSTRAGGVLGTALGLAFGGLFALGYAIDAGPALAVLTSVLAVAGIVAAPLGGETVARRL